MHNHSRPQSPKRFLSLTAALLVAGLVAACSRPYDTPEVQTSRRAPGVLELIDPISTAGALRGRLIATHGMCSGTHQRNWHLLRLEDYKVALGATTQEDFDPVPFDTESGTVLMNRHVLDGPEGRIELVLLRWGSHVDAARASLDYDNHRAAADAPAADMTIGAHPQRGLLSNRLRAQLMNECLIDAVVYSGTRGNGIRDGMRRALCHAIGGRPGTTHRGDPGSAASRLDCNRVGQTNPVPTMLLPESLGSTILLEAFNAFSPSEQVDRAMSDVRGIFLLSNQFPLLSLANAAPPGGRAEADASARAAGGPAPTANISQVGPLEPFLQRFVRPAAARRGETFRTWQFELVAISDPNDVFSYRVHPASIGQDVRVSNVLVSNTATYLGLVSDPVSTHSNYRRAPVFDIIMSGYSNP